MVNKFLIGVGLVALVAVGSIGVLKLADDDGRRVGALGPLGEPIALAWRGSWTSESKYDVGQVVSYEGSSYVAEAGNAGEVPNAKEGPWALMAAQGATGTFSGTLQSPDGKYTLSVTDAGIDARGPTGWVTIDNTGVVVKSANSLLLDSSATLNLKAAAAATLQGSIVRLGCSSGGVSIARLGDPIRIPNGQPAGVPESGQIIQGSPTVLAC